MRTTSWVVFGVNAANNLTLFSPVSMVKDELGTETVIANQATFHGHWRHIRQGQQFLDGFP